MSAAATASDQPTISVGYAALDPLQPSAERLVREADRSLYAVKLHGRGRSSIPTPIATAAPRDEGDPTTKSPGRTVVD